MKKDSVFFQKGLFEKPILNSRINTAAMTMKEKILGYLAGPFGILALVAIVNQIVEYIVHNRLMKDLSVLQDAPFTDNSSVVEVFTDLSVWLGIKRVIVL